MLPLSAVACCLRGLARPPGWPVVLVAALLLAGCARQPVTELLKWEAKCAAGADPDPGPPPAESIARPVRDAFLASHRCGRPRACAADADALARVVTRIGSDYAQTLEPKKLLGAALKPLRESWPLEPEEQGNGMLQESLDAVFALLDAHSRYWILDRRGRTLARGQGPAAERGSVPVSRHNGVRWRVLAPGIGYLAVGHFEADTDRQLERALAALRAKLDGPLKAAVLDLRGNSGGLLGTGVNLANALLQGGPVLRVDGRRRESRMRFSADQRDLLNGAPLLVLIDAGTASAAEIVAGALQDRGRARLLGYRSYGKGSVQTLYLPSCRVAIKITTARYTTPGGQSIDGRGLRPDIAYPDDCPGATWGTDPLLDCALERLQAER